MSWQSPAAPRSPFKPSSLLFQEGDKINEGFQPLVEALSHIPKPGESGWGRRAGERRGLLPTQEGGAAGSQGQVYKRGSDPPPQR